MTAEFVGTTDIQPVAVFPESRLGFPGLLTTLADVDPLDVHAKLLEEGHANRAGETYPLPATELEVDGSVFTITPIHSPFGERAPAADEEADVQANDVLTLIDEQLQAERPVALLYKTDANPESNEYEWRLLTGYYPQSNGDGGPYHTLHPKEEGATRLSRLVVLEMIQRSLNHIDAYACTLTTSEAGRDAAA